MSDSHTTNGQGANKCTETFWPLLRSALMSREVTFSDMELQCTICYTNMPLAPDPTSDEKDEDSHGPVIYPCGHMFGRSCFVNNVLYNTDNGRDVSCPICRGKYNYTKCKHPHYGFKMPRDMKGVEDFPTIVPQGGVVFELCYKCLVEVTLKTAGEKLRADPDMPEDLRHRATVSITVNGQTYYSQDTRGKLVDLDAPKRFKSYVAGLKAGLGFYEDSKILWMPGNRLRDMEIKCHSCPGLQSEEHE
ncbi:hypothetical protein ACHAPI_001168 [Fusarium lateritium]